MKEPEFPLNEKDRLAELKDLEILDSVGEAEYHNIIELASIICESPISHISLVDEDRVWFKSNLGFEGTEAPRKLSFCAHAINSESDLFEVENATQDTRFADNPFVEGEPHIRHYAGVPLISEKGNALGTLCVVDSVPKKLSPRQARALELLAQQALHLIKTRKKSIEHKEKMESFFHHSPSLLGFMTPDGTILDVNEAVVKIEGQSKDQIIGKKFWDRPRFKGKKKIQEQLKRMISASSEGSLVREDIRLPRGTKHSLVVDLIFAPHFDENGKVKFIVSEGSDISEKVIVQQKLTSIFDNTYSFTGILKPDGTVIEVNKAALELGGFSRETVVGEKFYDVLWRTGGEETRNDLINAINKAAGGEFVRCEVQIRGVNDKILTIDFSLKPVFDEEGVISYLIPEGRDITEIKRIQLQLAELNKDLEDKIEERTNSLRQLNLDLSNQLITLDAAAIVSMTDVNGSIIHANDKLQEISGYSKEKLLGQNHRILKSGKQPELLFSDLWSTISNGQIWEGELCNRSKSGELFWIKAIIHPHKSLNGEIDRYVMVAFDITENKNLSRELKRKAKQLKKNNKSLEALNQNLEAFSYSVSHDLKAPLRTIRGFSESLADKYSEQIDDTGKRWLKFIMTNAKRMDTLIYDILEYSRLSRKEVNWDVIDMNGIVDSTMEEFRPVYSNTIVFDRDNLPSLLSDRTIIRMVWHNLISNALKYSSHNEVIAVKISLIQDDEYVQFSISDNGIGFDMDYYDKVFGIFQRLHTDSEYEGTGVGLANVKRGVEKLGGTIEASSELGKGSVFMFKLPRNQTN